MREATAGQFPLPKPHRLLISLGDCSHGATLGLTIWAERLLELLEARSPAWGSGSKWAQHSPGRIQPREPTHHSSNPNHFKASV